MSAAVIHVGNLPAKLNTVIQPLMGAIRTGAVPAFRSVFCLALASLVNTCKPAVAERWVSARFCKPVLSLMQPFHILNVDRVLHRKRASCFANTAAMIKMQPDTCKLTFPASIEQIVHIP